ncbi:hypothetical protein AB0C47_13500 [Micromonospora taraxaci]|uniref:hypothetical protein n=1 Tax=Micromonospora taraxaci TaxID=1316803 RepID=UPI0033F142D4
MDTEDLDTTPAPSRFALLDYPDDEGPPTIVGWGLALPDGTTVGFSKRGGHTLFTMCASPDSLARLHNADPEWIDKEPPLPPLPRSPP